MLLCYHPVPLDPRFHIFFSLYFLEMSLHFVYLVQLLHDWPFWEGDSSFVALLRFPHFVLLYQLLSLLRHCDILLFKYNWKFDTLVKGWAFHLALLLTLRTVPYIKNFVCISYHLICSWQEVWTAMTAQTSEWLKGLECFQISTWLLCSRGDLWRLLSLPYLGLADELWWLMSEQSVKESACNEESAAWETDAIIFQIKLFHALPGSGRLTVAVAVTWWAILRSLFFWARCRNKYPGRTNTCEPIEKAESKGKLCGTVKTTVQTKVNFPFV